MTDLPDSGSVDEITDKLHSILEDLSNEYAPEICKEIVLRPNAPWYNSELAQLKKEKRRAERKWRKTKSLIDHEQYRENSKAMNKALLTARTDF